MKHLPLGRLNRGDLGAVVRFGVVGVAATMTYLGISLLLLDGGMAARAANLVALVGGTAASYLGHYFFTYRSREAHLRVGQRFVVVTAGLWLLCAALHSAVLWLGATPRAASAAIALTYPPLSFLANHFWAFYGSTRRGREANTGG